MGEKGGEYSGQETKPTEQFAQKPREGHALPEPFFPDTG
jgi:hypothetical protein